ncbi:MAG: serine/threonine protein kinase [Ruminococcaceae bacterium]|nr:serine/threonine protein kinase [Oscillospiraceae bacterium]
MFLNIGSVVFDGKGNEYTLNKILGQGGFGYVYKAIRKKDNCTFAVKISLPSFNSEDDIISFQNEITTALKVQGENVIKYEYVHNGNVFDNLPPYIIMEYAEGGTMNSILKDENDDFYDNEILTTYFLQLANGMRSVNDVLIHRDIKPDNILICNGTFKISDFGLAKIASESTRTMTFKGGGTPVYMSPEAWDYNKKNTIQMDIYSMGIIFYQLATNMYPYQMNGNSHEDFKNAHLYSTAVNPERVNRSLSPTLASIINKMLEKSAKRRFNNWDEIINLLSKQNSHITKHTNIVMKAITARNLDIEAQKKQDSLKLLKKQKEENFKKKVLSQFESDIISPLEEFIEDFNEQYAGEPIHGYFSDKYNNKSYFSFEILVDDKKYVKIVMLYCIDDTDAENNHDSNDDWYEEPTYGHQDTQLKYNRKDVWAFGIIKNHNDLGFNIILVDSGDIYGDWYILNNKNNFSLMTEDRKPEPFYLPLERMSEILYNVTGLYRSEIKEFKEEQFLSQIEGLAFEA